MPASNPASILNDDSTLHEHHGVGAATDEHPIKVTEIVIGAAAGVCRNGAAVNAIEEANCCGTDGPLPAARLVGCARAGRRDEPVLPMLGMIRSMGVIRTGITVIRHHLSTPEPVAMAHCQHR